MCPIMALQPRPKGLLYICHTSVSFAVRARNSAAFFLSFNDTPSAYKVICRRCVLLGLKPLSFFLWDLDCKAA